MLAVSDKGFVSSLGLMVSLLGMLVIVWGSVSFLYSDGGRLARKHERRLVAAGAFVVAMGFGLQLLSKLMTGGLH